jgi:hypothetical protein
MFNLILLFIDIALFILSFIFAIIDLKSYTKDENKEIDMKKFSKFSKYSLLCGFLALVLMIIVSFSYV